MPNADRFAGAVRVPHTTVRLDFVLDEPFEVVRDRFEAAVPAFDPEIFADDADWEQITRRTFSVATHAFLRYARLDGGPFFARAGHSTAWTSYLMGNHVYAERMFRHDPAIVLYAPLRVTLFVDQQGRTHLTVDQPSTRFDSFGCPEVAAVGEILDARLSELLGVLGAVTAIGP